MADGRGRAAYAHAPTPEVVKSAKADIERAVRRLLDDRRRLREAGYRSGVELAADDLLGAEWFRYWMALDPTILREHLNHRNGDADADGDGTVLERILVLFEEQTGLDPGEPEPDGPGLPEEFMAGVVGALHDVWQLVEDASDVKER
jgi:hypothetical protein